MPALKTGKSAQGNKLKHKSMVVESMAYSGNVDATRIAESWYKTRCDLEPDGI